MKQHVYSVEPPEVHLNFADRQVTVVTDDPHGEDAARDHETGEETQPLTHFLRKVPPVEQPRKFRINKPRSVFKRERGGGGRERETDRQTESAVFLRERGERETETERDRD